MSQTTTDDAAALDALLVGIAPPTSMGMTSMGMAHSSALVLDNAAVSQRGVQRLEEASLTVTLTLMIKTAAKQCG